MSNQHLIPAAFLGLFSDDTNPVLRNRMLFVGDKKENNIFEAPANKILTKKDFYTLQDFPENPLVIDDSFLRYESKLINALEELINKTILFQTWVEVLVPFATNLFIRTEDFNKRFEGRILLLGLEERNNSNNTNLARMMEFQRLASSIISAEWTVFETVGETPLIMNDLGYALSQNRDTRKINVAIPISMNHVLVIDPNYRRVIGISKDHQWWPLIRYGTLLKDEHNDLNKALDNIAMRFICGPNKEVISRCLSCKVKHQTRPEPAEIGFMAGHRAMVFEMTWFNAISVSSSPPMQDGEFLYVDYINNYRGM